MSGDKDEVFRETVPRPRGSNDPSRPWALLVLSSTAPELEDRHIELGEALRIGRVAASKVGLVIREDSVSRLHATIRSKARKGLYEIIDHGSTNGTYVNGFRVANALLHHGDIIRIGDTLLQVGALEAPRENRRQESSSELAGRSAELESVVEAADRIAKTDLSVLITGETGTGKELLATRIHRLSGRDGPLKTINCGAIPENLFESFLFGHKRGAFTGASADKRGVLEAAEGGTVFLDEIGEIPLSLQPKLLRVLENLEYTPVGGVDTLHCDVRFVAATNISLEQAAERSAFRKDLFARIAEFVLHVPPLRERKSDIAPLTRHFLKLARPRPTTTITADFLEPLLLHDWPMNVRELRSVVRQVCAIEPSAEALTDMSLPPHFRPWNGGEPAPRDKGAPLVGPAKSPNPTREDIIESLEIFDGNVTLTAKHLGISRAQMYRLLRRHEILPKDHR